MPGHGCALLARYRSALLSRYGLKRRHIDDEVHFDYYNIDDYDKIFSEMIIIMNNKSKKGND